MIKKLLTISILFTVLNAPTVVNAEGSATKGKAQAASCAGCHGEDGNSMMPNFPKLAGQHASYLIQQLLAFKNGKRNAPMMAPLAMGLDETAIENIAAYYSVQKISKNDPPVIEFDDDELDEDDMTAKEKAAFEEKKQTEFNDLMALGSDLYRNGDLTREVSACIACHGPYGEGNRPAAFPSLHSQHADYLIKSLTDFKNGLRANNPDNMMHMIAKKMTDREIKAVAYHISMMK